MYYNTGLSRHQQLAACKELLNYGIIKVKYHGIPKKRYFKFNPEAIEKLYHDFELHSNTTDEDDDMSIQVLTNNETCCIIMRHIIVFFC